MKPTGTPFKAALFIVMASCLFNLSSQSSAEQPRKGEFYTTNAQEKADCEHRLNIIYGAIQQYRKQNRGRLPDKLSDLTPDLIYDVNDLTCPFVEKHGGARPWRKQFVDLASDPFTSYSYEFPPVPVHYNLWRGLPTKTWRDSKLRTMEILGRPVVPIVRCHFHRPWLNLGYDGRVYESQTVYWERNFTNSDHALIPSILFASPLPSGPLAGADFPPRSRNANARLLDLTGVYNALMTSSWQGSPGNNLAGLLPGIHRFGGVEFDVRGVIQSGGSELPAAFPRRVDGIGVYQKCARIHFLHAVGLIYSPGDTNGSYSIHYSDGQVHEIPLVYGKQLADWWFDPQNPAEPTDARVAWIGENDAAKAHERSIRLYRFTWENPRKDAVVATISVAANAKAADGPFLIAITLD